MRSREDFIETLIHRYERYVAPFTFIIGFVFDTLTLRRIDIWFDHYILIGYLLLGAIGITVVNAYEAGHLHVRPWDWVVPFMPVMVQFVFGGLFSIFVIFYTKSGVIATSWIFLLVLCVLLIGNEHFRKQYQHLTFQLSIFFVVLFSYTIFALPLITKQIGTAMFLLSGIASLGLLGLFVFVLSRVTPFIKQSRRSLSISIGIIYLAFHVCYFANIIPPIPLSLKEGGVYHRVVRQDGTYRVAFESPPWYAFFHKTNSIYHWHEGELIYFFSSVFAPTQLNTDILHHWFYYDTVKNKWVSTAEILIPIIGGRDGGYRGYSFITSGKPGKWRVDVVTARGQQVLGREIFIVVKADSNVELRTESR